jgi:hypothetical protein
LSFIFIEVRGAKSSDVTSLYDHVTTANYRYIRPEIDLNTPTAVAFKFMWTNLQDLDDNTGKISIVGFFEIKWRDNNLKTTKRQAHMYLSPYQYFKRVSGSQTICQLNLSTF